jgi:hypothetical protein
MRFFIEFFFFLISTSSFSWSMNAANSVFAWLAEMGKDNVKRCLDLMKQPLDANKATVLAEETRLRQAETQARITPNQAIALNAEANRERERQNSLIQQDLNNQKEAARQRYLAELRANLERNNSEMDAHYRNELARQLSEDNLRANTRAEEVRRRLDAEANEERLRNEIQAARDKATAEAQKKIAILKNRMNLWENPETRQALVEMEAEQARHNIIASNNATKIKVDTIKEAFFQFTGDKGRMKSVDTFVGLTTAGTAAAILFAKNVLPIMRQWVEEYLFMPVLIEESSYSLLGSKREVEELKYLYFDAELQNYVHEIKNILANTKKQWLLHELLILWSSKNW